MQESLPIGPLITAILWLLIIPVVFIIILRVCKRRFLGEDEKKKTTSDLEDKFLKEIKDSYSKLSEEQRRKIDNIK